MSGRPPLVPRVDRSAGGTRIRIRLAGFENPAALYDAIAARLPVAVEHLPAALEQLRGKR